MPALYIDLNGIRDANYTVPSMGLQLDAVKRQSRRLKGQIPDCIQEKYQIGERLKNIERELEKLELQIDELYEVTSYCVEHYIRAEQRNSTNAKAFC